MLKTDSDPLLDDWLGEQGELDWLGDSRTSGLRRPEAPRRPADARSSGRSADGALGPDGAAAGDRRAALVARRRIVAFSVLVGVVVLAIAVPLVAFRGGGSTTSPPVTTAITSTPPTTTAPAPRPTTSTSPSTAPAPAQPASGFVLPAGTVLRPGDQGDNVKALQTALVTAGFAPGAADGIYGANTRTAVVAFQQANGLTADGVVGPETAAKLNAALAAGKTSSG